MVRVGSSAGTFRISCKHTRGIAAPPSQSSYYWLAGNEGIESLYNVFPSSLPATRKHFKLLQANFSKLLAVNPSPLEPEVETLILAGTLPETNMETQ